MTKFIAFYLPQYYPIPENDQWYGKGFTEWTNVAKAKPLFRGHYQPHIPADLGFYDLRLQETRRAQAAMAEEYGISAFCYWNYWFGEGKQLLTMPIWEVYKDKEIKLPFCLAWANHTWEKKTWDKTGNNQVIAEQKYLGEKDYTDYFYTILPLLKDERYYRVDGKLFFAIWDPLASPDIDIFIKTWRMLAQKENLGDFFFVGKDSACRSLDKIFHLGFDAVYDDNVFNIHHNLNIVRKCILAFQRKVLNRPTVFNYKDAIKYMVTDDAERENIIPVISPNWDHSPRSGGKAILLHDCKPEYFQKLVHYAIQKVSNKSDSKKIVLIKAWNEWGEGNHMEPDLKYGLGYLEALKKELEFENNAEG